MNRKLFFSYEVSPSNGNAKFVYCSEKLWDFGKIILTQELQSIYVADCENDKDMQFLGTVLKSQDSSNKNNIVNSKFIERTSSKNLIIDHLKHFEFDVTNKFNDIYLYDPEAWAETGWK